MRFLFTTLLLLSLVALLCGNGHAAEPKPKPISAAAETSRANETDSAPSESTSSDDKKTGWPDGCFAPYVDVCLWPTPDFEKAAAEKQLSIRHFVLAFVTAADGKACWGGQPTYPIGRGEFHQTIRGKIDAVRKAGGDVMISCGGANGVELAQSIKDVSPLQAAYQSVIDAYELKAIDFDIEGAAVAERDSIERRSQAIVGLQRAATKSGKPLKVWFTLPVLPSGLTPDGVQVLTAAVKAGVKIDGVNLMCMDYGDSAAPPRGKMGGYAIQAASSVHGQLKTLSGGKTSDRELWSRLGICPMIGLNDTPTETFTQQDARDVLAFAHEKHLGLLSMWSFTRDRANPKGAITYAEATSSSLAQEPLEFCNIFRGLDEAVTKPGKKTPAK